MSTVRKPRARRQNDEPQSSHPRMLRAVTAASPVVAGVSISTPARPVYPRLHFTKLDLAHYYAAVGPWMLKYVKDRPLTLVRCEKGASRGDALRSECKFLRHEPGWHRWAPAEVRRVHIQEQKKLGEYLVVDTLAQLISLVQGDILELHCWNARSKQVEQPDRLVFDVDPSPDVAWDVVRDAAVQVRDRLAQVGLRSWPKLTGNKGLHVVVPFRAELEWSSVYAVARVIAQSLVQDAPSLFTLDFGKHRRNGKVLLDYKRNHRGAVAVAAYSARAVPSGAVSVPVSWEELERVQASGAFTVHTLPTRLAEQARDPWAEFWRCKQSLRAAITRSGTAR